MSASKQVIFGFKKVQLVDVLNAASGEGPKQDKASNSKEICKNQEAMSVGHKLRVNGTPLKEDGSEYPGNDPQVNGPDFQTEEGKPIIRWSIEAGGKEVMDTSDNPFEQGSYEDNGGCTPTYKLLRQIGAGANQCSIAAYVNAEDNGGVACRSERTPFKAD